MTKRTSKSAGSINSGTPVHMFGSGNNGWIVLRGTSGNNLRAFVVAIREVSHSPF
jgi:hypothetical protein